MDYSLGQQPLAFDGASNRPRDWNARKKTPPSRPANPAVMRWDGASRSCEVWDSLRRDHELWFRDGDCYVYLHGEGQSRRGPAFKVSYVTLLRANFQPLIDAFKSQACSKPNDANGYFVGNHAASYLKGSVGDKIELFIPAPPEVDKRHSYGYHIATRNLFAFIFRRSMVGDCLGDALITLMHSLRYYRTLDANNVQDLINYMNEEGYLNLNGQPTYALAILRLAEAFRLPNLYTEAFAHCCGMSDQLFLIPEYQRLSPITRKLIRHTRTEMNSRLGNASAMLGTFLYDEICNLDVELYPGAWQHLERFRDWLQGIYAARFGCYPPSPPHSKTAVFEMDVFCEMRDDFEALYQFLVDGSPLDPQTNKPSARNGICTLGSVKSFDARFNYETLVHPHPLLPDIPRRRPLSWGVPWRSKLTTASQSRRVAHVVALSKATNSHRLDLVGHHLVRAYREFEEDQTFAPIGAYNIESLDPVDGRKVRWIMVYAIYQTLRHVTKVAAEVGNTMGVPYPLCISTADLPPWEKGRLARGFVHGRLGQSLLPLDPLLLPSMESKLDDEYDVLDSQGTQMKKRHSLKATFTGSTSRKPSILWRSLSLLSKRERPRPRPEMQKPTYHEIVVDGYGNGMNAVARDRELTANISPIDLPRYQLSDRTARSSSSGTSNSTGLYTNSEARTSGTSQTSVTANGGQSPTEKWESERASVFTRCGLHDANGGDTSPRWRKSLPANNSQHERPQRTLRFDDEKPSVPPRRRPTSLCHDPRQRLEPAPLNVCKGKEKSTPDLDIRMPLPQAPPTAWDHVQTVMEAKASNYESRVEAERDQSAPLGQSIGAKPDAYTSATDATSRRASAMF